jgi:hypothetical protein
MPNSAATAAALSFSAWSSILALKTSMMSAPPSAHSDGRTRPMLDLTRSNGCGTYTRPPWSLIRATTSASGSTYGIRSVRNSPITSPSGVRISSPTMIRTSRSPRAAAADASAAAEITL